MYFMNVLKMPFFPIACILVGIFAFLAPLASEISEVLKWFLQ